jgi:hypothetical protein
MAKATDDTVTIIGPQYIPGPGDGTAYTYLFVWNTPSDHLGTQPSYSLVSEDPTLATNAPTVFPGSAGVIIPAGIPKSGVCTIDAHPGIWVNGSHCNNPTVEGTRTVNVMTATIGDPSPVQCTTLPCDKTLSVTIGSGGNSLVSYNSSNPSVATISGTGTSPVLHVISGGYTTFDVGSNISDPTLGKLPNEFPFYNLVVINACYSSGPSLSSPSNDMAQGFHILNGGNTIPDCAYLGWLGVLSGDNVVPWNKQFWASLKSGNTVSKAITDADAYLLANHLPNSNLNHQAYGDPNTTLTTIY